MYGPLGPTIGAVPLIYGLLLALFVLFMPRGLKGLFESRSLLGPPKPSSAKTPQLSVDRRNTVAHFLGPASKHRPPAGALRLACPVLTLSLALLSLRLQHVLRA